MKKVGLSKTSIQIMRSKLHGLKNDIKQMEVFLDPDRPENFNLEVLQERCKEYYFDIKNYMIDSRLLRIDGIPYQRHFNQEYYISIFRKERNSPYIYRQIIYLTDKGFKILYKNICLECSTHPVKKLFDLYMKEVQKRTVELENSSIEPTRDSIEYRFDCIPGINIPMRIPGLGLQPDLKLP